MRFFSLTVFRQSADQACCLVYQLGVGGIYAFFQINIILQAHPAVTAGQHGVGHHGELVPPDTERAPVSPIRQGLNH